MSGQSIWLAKTYVNRSLDGSSGRSTMQPAMAKNKRCYLIEKPLKAFVGFGMCATTV